MKKNLSILFLTGCCFLLNAENLILNADFKDLSEAGLPRSWQVQGQADSIQSADGILKITASGNCLLVQRGLPLVPGREYDLNFAVKSPDGCSYRIYGEYGFLRDGKKNLSSINSVWRKADSSWKNHSVPFSIPVFGNYPYLVIQVKGPAQLELNGLMLTETVKPLLPIAGFKEIAPPGCLTNWRMKGAPGQFKFQENSVVMECSGKDPLQLIQSGKFLPGGGEYQLSYEVKTAGECQYRVYAEYAWEADGQRKFKSFGTEFNSGTAVWTGHKLVFSVPQEYGGIAIVLNVRGNGTVTFRNLELKKNETSQSEASSWIAFGKEWGMGAEAELRPNREIRAAGPSKLPSIRRTGFVLKPGTRYQISFEARGEGDSGEETGFHFFTPSMIFSDHEKTIGSRDDTWNDSFQAKRFVFRAPAGVETGEFQLTVQTRGAIQFRNFSIAELAENRKDEPEITLASPCWRNRLYASMPTSKIGGSLSGSNIQDAAIRLKSGNTVIAETQAVSEGGRFKFSFNANGLTVGKYRVEAEVRLKNGSRENTALELEKMPPGPVEVIPGANRNFYINGKVTFPIALWLIATDDPEAGFRHAAAQGVNLTLHSAPDAKALLKLLNLAWKYRIRIFLRTGYVKNNDENAFRVWQHRVSELLTPEVRAHEALFGYFLVDEPFWTGVPAEALQRCYRELQRLDPYRPVWINAAPRGTIAEQQPYAASADIYGVDIYPIPYPSSHSHLEDRSPSSVGKYTIRSLDITDRRKPIWMALQGFSWKSFKGTPGKEDYPSLTELRFMACDAVINGASSIGFWGTQYIQEPLFYDRLFAVTKELSEVSAALTAGPAGNVTVSGVEFRSFQVPQGFVILAANASSQPATATFTVPHSVSDIRTENRRIMVADGRFTDTFTPYTARIYIGGKLHPADSDIVKLHPAEKDPFHTYIERRRSAVPYRGQANWIWDRTNYQKPSSRAELSRTFTVTGKDVTAVMLAAADDNAEIYCNDRLVGKVTCWNYLERFDLNPFLKNGSNTVKVIAQDAGVLPCGFLAEIRIDGQPPILTCADWRDVQGNPAHVVAPYGSGAWGHAVKQTEK